MSSNITYLITMGSGLALSVDPNGKNAGSQLVLANKDQSSGLQRWAWVFYPQTQASILYNPYLNMFAAPSAISKGAAVVLFSADKAAYNGSNTWQVFQGSAVRPPQDTDLNLNAFGDSWNPGTKVGLWSWDRGAQNEIWTSTVVSPSVEMR